MFGLFKKASPEERLTEEIAKMIESTVNLAKSDTPITPMQGTHVVMALKACKDSAVHHAPRLAMKYNLPISTVYRIIENCMKKAMDYYFL